MPESHRPDPDRSRAVVIGAGSYLYLGSQLPQASSGARTFAEFLRTAGGIDRVDLVSAPSSPSRITVPVDEAARDATDVLLVYYAGHGLIDKSDRFYLATESTTVLDLDNTAVSYDALRRQIASKETAAYKILILDCCFSGSALHSPLPGAPIENVMLLCSVGPRDLGFASPDGIYPAFTKDLLEILTGPAEPTLGGLYQGVLDRAKRAGRTRPIMVTQDEASWLMLKATEPTAPKPVPVTGDPGRDIARNEPVVAPKTSQGAKTSAPTRRADPAGSRMLLAGATFRLPQAEHNVAEIARALTDERTGVLHAAPANCRTLLNAPNAADLQKVAQDVAAEARDVLVVYYSGLARVYGGDLELVAAPSGGEGQWLSLGDLLGAVRSSTAPVRLVLLDCLTEVEPGATPIDWERYRELLAGPHKIGLIASIAPADPKPTGSSTAVTGELLDLLYNGVPSEGEGPPPGTCERIVDVLVDRIGQLGLPTPWHALGSAAGLELTLVGRPLPPSNRPLRILNWVRQKPLYQKIVVSVLAAALSLGPSLWRPVFFPTTTATCGTPLELRVIASPQSFQLTSAVADAFAAGETASGCRRYHLTVYQATTDSVLQALGQANDWTSATCQASKGNGSAACFVPSRDVGPQPDIWLPDSTADSDLATLRADKGAVRIVPMQSIAWTPLVAAVSKSAGLSLGARQMDWHDLQSAVADAHLSLVRTDPTTSTTGLLQTAGLYSALAPGLDPGQVKTVEDDTEQVGAVRSGLQLTDDEQLVCGTGQSGVPKLDGDALLISEKAMLDYDLGDAKSPVGRCAQASNSQLLAYYPSSTAILDHPLVRLDWTSQNGDRAARQQAVAAFQDWLLKDGQSLVAHYHFRPVPITKGSVPVDSAGAADPAFDPSTHRAPDEATLQRDYAAYQGAHKPGRVIFLLDVSQSMQDRGKLSAAENTITQAAQTMGGKDTAGLLTVPVSTADDHDPAGSLQLSRDQLSAALTAVKPMPNGAALYSAISAALTKMRGDGWTAQTGSENQALVVLTDGEDTDSSNTRNRSTIAGGDLINQVRQAGIPVRILAFEPAGCSGAGQADALIPALVGDPMSRCVTVGDAPDQATVTGLGSGFWAGGNSG
ncbi:MAG: solute-binding protein [Catenulispora sp.]|nr:solute-binding protein [Catenulispora sp.]